MRNWLLRWLHHFIFLLAMFGFKFLHMLNTYYCFLFFLSIGILVCGKWYLIGILIWIFLRINDVENVSCICWPLLYTLWRNVHSHFLTCLNFCYLSFLLLTCRSFFNVTWIVSVEHYQDTICKNALLLFEVCFHFLDCIFWNIMALNLNEVQVILYNDIYSMVYLANLFMNANCFVDSLEFFQIQNQVICKYSFTYSIHTLVNFIFLI